MMFRAALAPVLAALTVSSLACEATNLAYGDVNSIIVGADTELWSQVGDTLTAALQPTITTTVAEEEVFQVTHQDPADSLWSDFRLFRQLLLLGQREDPWIADALDRMGDIGAPPAVARADDLWARGQTVTVVLLPEEGPSQAVMNLLPDLREGFLTWYRNWTHDQMFVTGENTELSDTLRAIAGFELTVPRVYTWERRDSAFIFRNDNPDPSELIRQFTVTWMSPPPDTLTIPDLVAWRNELSASYYDPAQLADTALMSQTVLTVGGRDAYRLQAVWQNPPEAEWPAAGSFIIQTVPCPEQDRLYLTDAWLYAPGRDKFEYLYQLETILGSFRCGDA
jgi:hypothetical protein